VTSAFLHRAGHLLVEAIGTHEGGPAHVEIFGGHQLAEPHHVLLQYGESIIIKLNFTYSVGLAEVLNFFDDALSTAGSQCRHGRVAERAFARATASHQHVDRREALVGPDGRVVLVHGYQVVRRERILIEIHLDGDRRIVNHCRPAPVGNAADSVQRLALKNREKSLLAVAAHDDVDRGIAQGLGRHSFGMDAAENHRAIWNGVLHDPSDLVGGVRRCRHHTHAHELGLRDLQFLDELGSSELLDMHVDDADAVPLALNVSRDAEQTQRRHCRLHAIPDVLVLREPRRVDQQHVAGPLIRVVTWVERLYLGVLDQGVPRYFLKCRHARLSDVPGSVKLPRSAVQPRGQVPEWYQGEDVDGNLQFSSCLSAYLSDPAGGPRDAQRSPAARSAC
jgi:hypothetical protein